MFIEVVWVFKHSLQKLNLYLEYICIYLECLSVVKIASRMRTTIGSLKMANVNPVENTMNFVINDKNQTAINAPHPSNSLFSINSCS